MVISLIVSWNSANDFWKPSWLNTEIKKNINTNAIHFKEKFIFKGLSTDFEVGSSQSATF